MVPAASAPGQGSTDPHSLSHRRHAWPARSSQWGRAWLVLVSLLLVLSAAIPTTAAKNLQEVSLPVGYKPEGVASGWGDNVYVGSLLGRVIKVDVKTSRIDDVLTATDLEPFIVTTGVVASPGGSIGGLKVSIKTRLLIVAGGVTGGAWVVKLGPDGLVDRRTAAANSIQFIPLASNPARGTVLVNDVALREGYKSRKTGKPGIVAYLTDSLAHCLYQLECSSDGECSKTATYTDPTFIPPPPPTSSPALPLSLNGIVADPLPADTLLVGLTTQAKIMKVVITGSGSISVTPVTIQDGSHSDGVALATDGLLPDGKKRLFAVENRANRVAQLEFTTDDYTTAVVVQRVTDPAFANPSTAAKAAGSLYVANSRFASCPAQQACPDEKFQLVRVNNT